MSKPQPQVETGVRLQRVLAAAGLGSRRACEQLIAEGRVVVDGHTVRSLGTRVDPGRAVISVDGVRVPSAPDLVHYAFHKPTGVLSTMSDPGGRPSLADYVPTDDRRLYHVGRLDAASEGLLLITNDGELAHRLMHPSYEVPKTYVAEIAAPLDRQLGARLRAGISLDDGPVTVDSFRVVSRSGARAMVELTLHEGRNHVVRRLLAAAGHPVRRLVRVQIGSIRLGHLKPGQLRRLRVGEVRELYRLVGL